MINYKYFINQFFIKIESRFLYLYFNIMDGAHSGDEVNFLTQQLIQLQEIYEQRLTKKDEEIEQLKVDLSDGDDKMRIDQLSQTIIELHQTESELKCIIDGLNVEVSKINKENSELKQIIQRLRSDKTAETFGSHTNPFDTRVDPYQIGSIDHYDHSIPSHNPSHNPNHHIYTDESVRYYRQGEPHAPVQRHPIELGDMVSLKSGREHYDRTVSNRPQKKTSKKDTSKKDTSKKEHIDSTPRCAGYTGSGEKCKNPSMTGNRFCHAHQKSRTCKGTTDKGSPCKNTCLPDREFCIHHQRMSKRCTHTLTSGERCKNISHGGSSKCSRHLAL
jgi:hypothetical protein